MVEYLSDIPHIVFIVFRQSLKNQLANIRAVEAVVVFAIMSLKLLVDLVDLIMIFDCSW